MKNGSTLRIPFTWEERRPVFIDRCLYIPAHYNLHEKWEKIPFSHPSFFGNSNPVVIEYCSGNGQWIVERAKDNPGMNWIAVEKKFDRSQKIWKKIHIEELTNIFVVCGDARIFSSYYIPEKSISKIFVNFPDPWPKLRHAKHRLLQVDFFQLLEKQMVRGATAFFNTDDFPYVERILSDILPLSNWKSLLPSPYFATDLPDYGQSYFYDLWKSKGRNIYSLQFEVQ